MRGFAALFLFLAGTILCFGTPSVHADSPEANLPQIDPEAVGLVPAHLKHIAGVVNSAIKAGELPGVVVLVGRHGKIAYLEAFGYRSVEPEKEAMTADTIFDVSSLTKVVATTPAIMLLVENGSLRLADPVKRYLPKFSGGGKDRITVNQLLTHYSGLPADFDLSREWFGYEAALRELWEAKTTSVTGEEFVYSDINFIALGEIIRTVSGRTLDAFAHEHLFQPLSMTDTSFHPQTERIGRIAPTEYRSNTLRYLKGKASGESMKQMLRGEVHDPTAFRMGGVAGHAGLFSTARDLAAFARMILEQGAHMGRQILSAQSVRAMTSPQSPAGSPQVRGYGWDIESSYSSPRGDLLKNGFGHTGFTGASLWIHPPTDTFIIVLSNRVHPRGGKSINHLRAVIANIVATAITDSVHQ